jgi:hypothetical protein
MGYSTGIQANPYDAPAPLAAPPATPYTVAEARPVAPSPAYASPSPYAAARQPRPQEQKHRIIPVALITLAVLLALGMIMNAKRNAESKLSADSSAPALAPNQQRAAASPSRAQVTTAPQSVTGLFTPEQDSARTQLLSGNFRMVLVDDSVPTDGTAGVHFDAEYRFVSDKQYSARGTIIDPDGTTIELEIIQIGLDRYVRLSTIPSLGDRWLKNPATMKFDFSELVYVAIARGWNVPGTKKVGLSEIDGVPLEQYSAPPTSRLKKADIWADGAGTPFQLVTHFQSTVPIGGKVMTLDDNATVKFFYNEVSEVTAPTAIVSEDDLRAGN